MIPLLAIAKIRNKRSRGFRLWIPLFLVWLLLLPVLLLLLPLIFVVCLAGRVNPFRTLSVVWQILSALKSTHIEIENRNASALIQIF